MLKLATVKEVSNLKVRLLIDGEESTTDKYYRCMYNPAVNDRVLIAQIGDTYIVVGKLY